MVRTCPHCNGYAKTMTIPHRGRPGVMKSFVKCQECHASGPVFFCGDDIGSVAANERRAIEAWNRRDGMRP